MWSDGENGAPFGGPPPDRRGMEATVRDAVAQGHVSLAFQPVVQALRPDRVAFHAGLIRVLDPQGRPLPEAEVAAAVEATATGRELDRLALRLGLEALAAEPGLRLSVGMSARSIGYPRWTRALREGLMRDRTVGERLILEIPERSALLLPDLVAPFIADQARQRISFALAGFGAGYTALRHLTELRFDLLKLDGGLVRGVARHPQNQVLIRALATVAATFDIFTLAPSVDRGEDADWLTGAGIDCLQGSYFAAPTMHPPWVSLGPRAQA